MYDEDIKIAAFGDDKNKNTAKNTSSVHEEYEREAAKGNIEKAKLLGERLSDEVVAHINSFPVDEEEPGASAAIAIQRGILMTFAALMGLEENIFSTVVHQAAKNSFNARLEIIAPELYKAVADSGAFSFYYLAYRRGDDVVRRMGQTFAMLCSHDGDPVYQELGEAIYCWFKSLTEQRFGEAEIE